MKPLKNKSAVIYLNIREITQFNSTILLGKIISSIHKHNNVILDMSKINYINSIGFGMIIEINKIARLSGCKIQIINLKDHLIEIVSLLRLDRVLEGTYKKE